MQITVTEQFLPFYEALASNVRIRIIHLLAERPMNIKELAAALSLSSAIVSMHVKKLEEGKLIKSSRTRINGAVQKLCSLSVQTVTIDFPSGKQERKCHSTSVSVGHFTDFLVAPTCGLATGKNIIGNFDDPRAFLAPERVDAKILWFSQGYIEYRIPNYLLKDQEPQELTISLELSSEAPGTNEHWPSDISFIFNQVELGVWTSPGDFGAVPGKLTPIWWSRGVNQYGVLKLIRINRKGTFIDGNQISTVTIDHIDIRNSLWTFRIEVPADAVHVGGATLFGNQFGNYPQDIVFTLYYT